MCWSKQIETKEILLFYEICLKLLWNVLRLNYNMWVQAENSVIYEFDYKILSNKNLNKIYVDIKKIRKIS